MLKTPRKKSVTVSLVKCNTHMIAHKGIAITSAAEAWIQADQCKEGATRDRLEYNKTPQPNRGPTVAECKTFGVND
jgi:hypothetical protein